MARSGLNHWQRACAVMGIVVFVVALMGGLLAAATDGGGTLAVTASSATAYRSSTPGSAPVPAAVRAQAERSLIQPSDLPSSWVAGAGVPASQSSPWSKQLAACVGVPSQIAAMKPTKLSSPSYTASNHATAVEDSVSVYPNAADAQHAFDALASGRTPGCMNRIGAQALRASVQDEAGAGTSVGTVNIAALAPSTRLPGQTGYTVTIPLAGSGRELTITSTAIQFVRGRFVHQLTFNGNGVAFPALLQVHLTQLAEARN